MKDIKTIKSIAGTASILLAALTAFLNYKFIKSMYYGYVAFMEKIYGESFADSSVIKTDTMIIAVIAVLFVLALIYLGIMLLHEESGSKKVSKKRNTIGIFALAILLLAADIMYFYLIPPTKLMAAIAEGKPAGEIRELIKKSPNINAVREGYSALSFAVFSAIDAQTLKTFAENGADANIREPKENMPVSILFLSSVDKNSGSREESLEIRTETLKAFINNGMDVNAETYKGGVTAFTSALGENAAPEIVQMLIDAGADIDRQEIDPVTGKKGVSAVMITAIDESKPEITKVLIDNGANLHVRTDSGVTVLMAAAGHDKNIELVKAAVEEGVNVNAKTARGTTALMTAARNNKGLEIIDFLIDNKADINIRDNEGNTAADHLKDNGKMSKADKKKAEELLKR